MITILSALVSLLSFRVRTAPHWSLSSSPRDTRRPFCGGNALVSFGGMKPLTIALNEQLKGGRKKSRFG